MTLTTKFLGHASLYLQTDQIRVVTDPWFSKDGAFLHSWFQYPDNTELGSVLDEIRGVDYVLLSHEHQDHFDLEFLKTISPKARILIPRFHDDYLYRVLKEHLPNPIGVVESKKPIDLSSDLRFHSIVQSVPIWDDSTMIFESHGITIANCNDMKVGKNDLEWIAANFSPDYLFIQFSGANWHPYVYDYALEKKASIAKQKIANKFKNVRSVMQRLGARYLVPCAGPSAFLDDQHFELNFSSASTFPTQRDFYEFARAEGFADEVVVMIPGDTLGEGSEHRTTTLRALEHPAYSDRRNYLELYRDRRRGVIETSLSRIEEPRSSLLGKCQAYFQPLVTSSAFFRRKLAGKFVLESLGSVTETFTIDFAKETDSVTLGAPASSDWFYRFRVESKLLNLVFDRKLTWEQLFLSLRFEASRQPDVYSEYLTVFLRFADPASYRAFERYERERNKNKRLEETFELRHEGKTYTMQRLCPHAMGDLSKGHVENGHVVCPLHGWAFSLKDGSCLHNPCSIRVAENPAPAGAALQEQTARASDARGGSEHGRPAEPSQLPA